MGLTVVLEVMEDAIRGTGDEVGVTIAVDVAERRRRGTANTLRPLSGLAGSDPRDEGRAHRGAGVLEVVERAVGLPDHEVEIAISIHVAEGGPRPAAPRRGRRADSRLPYAERTRGTIAVPVFWK